MTKVDDEQPLDLALKVTGVLLAVLGFLNVLDSGGGDGSVLVAGILLVIASYLRRIIRLLQRPAEDVSGSMPDGSETSL